MDTKHLSKYERGPKSNNNLSSKEFFLKTMNKKAQITKQVQRDNRAKKDKSKLESTFVNDMKLIEKNQEHDSQLQFDLKLNVSY